MRPRGYSLSTLLNEYPLPAGGIARPTATWERRRVHHDLLGLVRSDAPPVRAEEPVRPWDEHRALPPHLRPTALAWAVLVVGSLGAAVAAFLSPADHELQRLARAAAAGSGAAYAIISYIDFREHFLLEKALTGKWWSTRALPLGETLNHAGSGLTLLLLLLLARPVVDAPTARDVVVFLLAPAFLLLGLRDEFVFHRRRSSHREDLMHTTAHLAGGALIASWLVLRVVDWSR